MRPFFLPSRISSRARRSEGAAEGKPMSMMWTPASESMPASSYFCSGVKATPGRLLAVAQRGVVEPDLLRARERGAGGEARGRGDEAVEGLAQIDHA